MPEPTTGERNKQASTAGRSRFDIDMVEGSAEEKEATALQLRQWRAADRMAQRQKELDVFNDEVEERNKKSSERFASQHAAEQRKAEDTIRRMQREHHTKRVHTETREEQLRSDLWEEEELEITIFGQEHRLIVQTIKHERTWSQREKERLQKERDADHRAVLHRGNLKALLYYETEEGKERTTILKQHTKASQPLWAAEASALTVAKAAQQERKEKEWEMEKARQRAELQEKRDAEVRDEEERCAAVERRLLERSGRHA